MLRNLLAVYLFKYCSYSELKIKQKNLDNYTFEWLEQFNNYIHYLLSKNVCFATPWQFSKKIKLEVAQQYSSSGKAERSLKS